MTVKTELRGIFTAITKKLPGADQRLLKLLHDRDAETRVDVVHAIHEKPWLPFAAKLAARLGEETEPSVRSALIAACGDLRTPETLDALLAAATADLETPTDDRGALLFELRKHADERARDYFEAIFDEESTNENEGDRLLAAWGLRKLGDAPDAEDFLLEMLEEPVADARKAGQNAGLSHRAAQALEDLGITPRKSITKRARRT